MKLGTIEDLRLIVERIQKANFSRVDLRSLLIILRYVPPNYQSIRDIANFVAHEDRIERGILRDRINDCANRFVIFTKIGGSFTSPDLVYKQKEVINQLYETLKKYDIPGLNKELFMSQAFDIMLGILEIVADTKIQTDNADIQNCYLSPVEKDSDGFTVYFCFEPIFSPQKFLNAKTVKMPVLKADLFLSSRDT
jgi:hypothetical protein